MLEHWKNIDVRWGFRKKGNTGIHWVQKNKGYEQIKGVETSAVEVSEEDKDKFAPFILPEALSQENRKNLEVVVQVQVKGQPGPLASIRLPVDFSLLGGSMLSAAVSSNSPATKAAPPTQVKMAAGDGYDRTVVVSWKAAANSNGKIVGYELAGGATTAPWSTPAFIKGLSYTIPSRELPSRGTPFEVRVRAKGDSTSNTANSSWVRLAPVTAAAPPRSLRARANHHEVPRIYWKSPLENNTAGKVEVYEVTWSTLTGDWYPVTHVPIYSGAIPGNLVGSAQIVNIFSGEGETYFEMTWRSVLDLLVKGHDDKFKVRIRAIGTAGTLNSPWVELSPINNPAVETARAPSLGRVEAIRDSATSRVTGYRISWTNNELPWKSPLGKPTVSVSGYELSWGATTEPWSSPVFTSNLSYTIPASAIPLEGERFEIRVRAKTFPPTESLKR
ncbi:MAG: hypothetical protein AAF975_08020, partial [Spirochaetota bacterium]